MDEKFGISAGSEEAPIFAPTSHSGSSSPIKFTCFKNLTSSLTHSSSLTAFRTSDPHKINGGLLRTLSHNYLWATHRQHRWVTVLLVLLLWLHPHLNRCVVARSPAFTSSYCFFRTVKTRSERAFRGCSSGGSSGRKVFCCQSSASGCPDSIPSGRVQCCSVFVRSDEW